MTSNSYFSGGAEGSWNSGLVRWTPALRCVLLIVFACVLAGCADDVVLENPRTGMTAVCRHNLHGLDPWSLSMGCVASFEAQGWTRSGPE